VPGATAAHLVVQAQAVHAVCRACQHQRLRLISSPLEQANTFGAASAQRCLLREHTQTRGVQANWLLIVTRCVTAGTLPGLCNGEVVPAQAHCVRICAAEAGYAAAFAVRTVWRAACENTTGGQPHRSHTCSSSRPPSVAKPASRDSTDATCCAGMCGPWSDTSWASWRGPLALLTSIRRRGMNSGAKDGTCSAKQGQALTYENRGTWWLSER